MHELKPTHWLQRLQPLRVPAGWQIGWNTFLAEDAGPEGFGGDSLLYLIRTADRLVLDVEWRPEFDPAGHYQYYAELPPSPADPSADYQTLDRAESRSREEVVAWLNRWLARGAAEAPPPQTDATLPPAPAETLHPLRVVGGWRIERNTITETPPPLPAPPDASAPLLFRAIDEQRRFRLDVLGSPAAEPTYTIDVLYAPWPRTERGRRRQDVPLDFESDTVRVMHRFTTTIYSELVRYLEAWLCRAGGWAVEGH